MKNICRSLHDLLSTLKLNLLSTLEKYFLSHRFDETEIEILKRKIVRDRNAIFAKEKETFQCYRVLRFDVSWCF